VPWLQDVLTEVFADLYDGLRVRPVVRDKPRPRSDIDMPWGQPGHVLGVLRTYQSRPMISGRDIIFSEKSWQRFLSRLRTYPHAVDVGINELDDRGLPVHVGYAGFGLRRDFYLPEWCRFTFALDIPAGRPFRAENRGWLPADAGVPWSLEAGHLPGAGSRCRGSFSVASSTRI
jgi:hypothetical protein